MYFNSPSSDRALERRRASWVGALLVAATAVVVSLHGIGDKPLWNDEAWSIANAGARLSDTVDAIRHDYHPPLYYVTLNLWMRLGADAAWARSLSALFAVAATLTVFRIGSILAGPMLGFVSGLVLATAPLLVEWSQVARGYAELDFAVALALLGASRLLARPLSDPVPAWSWLAYIVGAAMALWIHNLAAFFLVGVNLAALARWSLGWRCDRRFAIRWVAAQLAIVALYLPWVPSLLAQVGNLGTAKHFLSATWESYRLDIVTHYGVSSLWTLGPPSLAVAGMLAAWGLSRRQLASGGTLLLSVVLLSPPIVTAVLFSVGIAFFGVVIGKLMWLAVPYSLAQGSGVLAAVQGLRGGFRFSACLGLLLAGAFAVLQIQGLRNLYASPNPAWDQAAEITRGMTEPGDAVMDDPTQPALAYAYYCRALGVTLPHVYPAGTQRDLVQWMARYRRLWVPVPMPMPPQDNLLPDAITAAKDAGMQVQQWPYRSLVLYLISAPGPKDRSP